MSVCEGWGERSLGLSEYRATLPYDNHKLPENMNRVSYGCNLDRLKRILLCCTFASEKLVEGENSESRISCLLVLTFNFVLYAHLA